MEKQRSRDGLQILLPAGDEIGSGLGIGGIGPKVVEIVKGSLKVQSEEGTIRSFNASALRKLYGKA